MTSAVDDSPRTSAARTAAFVQRTINPIQEQYVGSTPPTSYARAALARLRRGLGKPLGAVPDLMEFVVDAEAPQPRGDQPTRAEVATYTALTLYGLHQQSQSRRMHDPRTTFARAVGALRFSEGEENDGVLRRFQALATATDMGEFVHHTRGLISLLRTAERGFDYGRLAQDLVHFQSPHTVDRVRLAWGRDFYRTTPPTVTPTPSKETS